MECNSNKLWGKANPRISIITPVFNRDEELKRAFESVKAQSYKDFEYIIVNDGSTIDIDNTIIDFLNTASFPVLYIKKENGGVHTARNIAIKYCRGEMIYPLDSDDEMLPNSLKILITAWDSILTKDKMKYREVCGRVRDEKGNEIGGLFPNNINSYSLIKSSKLASKVKGEHFGFWKADIMKANPWPEPEGITFVSERTLWTKLSQRYKSFYINDIVRIYHTDNESLTRIKKRSIQNAKNALYNNILILNNDKHVLNLRTLCIVCVLKAILKRQNCDFKAIRIKRFFQKLLYFLFYIPCWPISIYIEKRRYNC